MSDEIKVSKSPDSALIGGIVAGFASLVLLVLILVIVWRTRKRVYVSSQPGKPIVGREESQVSTHSDFPITTRTHSVDSGRGEKDDGPRASRASSKTCSRGREESLSRGSPV